MSAARSSGLAELTAEALWEFSLEVYGREGVGPACLGLQDRHALNVNVLLLCCWLARHGRRALAGAELARLEAAVAPWHAAVILPLRGIRGRLKRAPHMAPREEDAAALRRRVLEIELDAERLEQDMLVRALGSAPAARAAPREAAAASLEAYLEARGVRPGGADRAALEVLIAAAVGEDGGPRG